jgi:hypothetical protein
MTCLRRSNNVSRDCFLASSLSIPFGQITTHLVRYYYCRVNSVYAEGRSIG